MKFFFALLISFSCFAAYENPDEAFELTPDEIDPSYEDLRFNKKEKYDFDESLVQITNTELGIQDQRRFTGLDRNKFSAALHLNGQYEYLQKLLGFEVTYLRRMDNWSKLWVGATLRRSTTQWDQISTKSDEGGGEPTFQRPNDAEQTINTLGLGFGYRFKLFLDFFKTENVFESVQAFATYNNLSESFTGDNYTGYGLTADYGLHKRTRQSFFYGAKFTYNLSWVAVDKDRDFSLSWYTFAFETGFIF
jgi:hypothetical protein